MKIWIVIAMSCMECNRMTVASFDHEPTEEEINDVSDVIGGICLTTKVFKSFINNKYLTEYRIEEY